MKFIDLLPSGVQRNNPTPKVAKVMEPKGVQEKEKGKGKDKEKEKEKETDREQEEEGEIGQSAKRVYHLHRCILSARSPHFRSMFSLGLKETDQRVVHIHDINPVLFAKVRRMKFFHIMRYLCLFVFYDIILFRL